MSCFGFRCIILDGLKPHEVVRGRNIVITDRAGLLHTTFAVLELQPSLFHRLDHGPDFPTDKDLTEFYQQSQWLGKGQQAEAPKASSTSK